MSTLELKKKLKEKIEELNEDYFLEELLNIIALENDKTKVIDIPEEHKKGLEISLKQMDSGKVTSHEETMKKLKNDLGSKLD